MQALISSEITRAGLAALQRKSLLDPVFAIGHVEPLAAQIAPGAAARQKHRLGRENEGEPDRDGDLRRAASS